MVCAGGIQTQFYYSNKLKFYYVKQPMGFTASALLKFVH